jgi:anhydro-N-acetylmuramic acid kinase
MDCGAGGALMDDVARTRLGKNYDKNGELAASGRVHEETLQRLLAHEFFNKKPPKSLDRNAFDVCETERFSAEDALATLCVFTVEGIARGLELLPEMPNRLLVTGGGRHNTYLMQSLQKRLKMKVEPVEAAGWNGDMLEAEAFAYLAARSVRGLPLSLPTTTGVPQAVTGGAFYPA